MKKKYSLPECDRERVNREQMKAIRWCMIAADSMEIANDILADRIKCVPGLEARWRMMVGSMISILTDLLGTVPLKQCLTIQRTGSDMEIRMVPKLSLKSDRAAIGLNDLSYLVSHAKKDICTACILDGDECRQCDLYKILESIAPLQDWGSSTVCPYLKDDWMDR